MTEATIQQILFLKKKKFSLQKISIVTGETEKQVNKILRAKQVNKPKKYNYKFDWRHFKKGVL